VPKFVQVRNEAVNCAGHKELAAAYDHVAAEYQDFWLAGAGEAVELLVSKLNLRGDETIFEAGCGTGFGSALLAGSLNSGGRLVAADISEGMLSVARQRLAQHKLNNVEFQLIDALAALKGCHDLDVVFTSWVLGYVPLRPFFIAAAGALRASGRVALVVHKESSPRREWETFAQIIADEPSLLTKQVAFDFPRDANHLREQLGQAGLVSMDLWESSAVFRYRSPEEVLEHLLKSGAGTVFYDAIDPLRRDQATRKFIELLNRRHAKGSDYEVRHDYLGCIAAKAQ
jgi:SAM-dependent methyltransferase